jgi:uncharacterized protein (DUF1800 family)
MMQAEIAVLRFGLGARPGELADAAGDSRAWLMAQVKGAAPLAVSTPLAASDQIFAGLLAARDERRKMKQESAAAATDAKVVDAIREAYQPHYRAQGPGTRAKRRAHGAAVCGALGALFGQTSIP